MSGDRVAVLKLVFGFLTLIILAALAGVIALGKVEQSTSHGLDIILGGLINMAGGFANWAFSSSPQAPMSGMEKPE